MIDAVLHSLQNYYGLDWLAFASGMAGMMLITRKSRWGFLLCGMSSLSGFLVAMISLQFGYVIYNFLLAAIMVKGFADWGRPEKIKIRK
jgi:hypothetical protein